MGGLFGDDYWATNQIAVAEGEVYLI
jgi:hypothetical protein